MRLCASGVTAGVRAGMAVLAVPDARLIASPLFEHATQVLSSLEQFDFEDWFSSGAGGELSMSD
jgi:beta-phosphoglucomutase-like phosphatase (HAD superfamily)